MIYKHTAKLTRRDPLSMAFGAGGFLNEQIRSLYLIEGTFRAAYFTVPQCWGSSGVVITKLGRGNRHEPKSKPAVQDYSALA